MTWQRGGGRPCDVVVVVALLGVIAHPRGGGVGCRWGSVLTGALVG